MNFSESLNAYILNHESLAKLTNSQLGRRCGVSSQLFYLIRSGKRPNPNFETVVKIVTGIGADPAFFIKPLDKDDLSSLI